MTAVRKWSNVAREVVGSCLACVFLPQVRQNQLHVVQGSLSSSAPPGTIGALLQQDHDGRVRRHLEESETDLLRFMEAEGPLCEQLRNTKMMSHTPETLLGWIPGDQGMLLGVQKARSDLEGRRVVVVANEEDEFCGVVWFGVWEVDLPEGKTDPIHMLTVRVLETNEVVRVPSLRVLPLPVRGTKPLLGCHFDDDFSGRSCRRLDLPPPADLRVPAELFQEAKEAQDRGAWEDALALWWEALQTQLHYRSDRGCAEMPMNTDEGPGVLSVLQAASEEATKNTSPSGIYPLMAKIRQAVDKKLRLDFHAHRDYAQQRVVASQEGIYGGLYSEMVRSGTHIAGVLGCSPVSVIEDLHLFGAFCLPRKEREHLLRGYAHHCEEDRKNAASSSASAARLGPPCLLHKKRRCKRPLCSKAFLEKFVKAASVYVVRTPERVSPLLVDYSRKHFLSMDELSDYLPSGRGDAAVSSTHSPDAPSQFASCLSLPFCASLGHMASFMLSRIQRREMPVLLTPDLQWTVLICHVVYGLEVKYNFGLTSEDVARNGRCHISADDGGDMLYLEITGVRQLSGDAVADIGGVQVQFRETGPEASPDSSSVSLKGSSSFNGDPPRLRLVVDEAEQDENECPAPPSPIPLLFVRYRRITSVPDSYFGRRACIVDEASDGRLVPRWDLHAELDAEEQAWLRSLQTGPTKFPPALHVPTSEHVLFGCRVLENNKCLLKKKSDGDEQAASATQTKDDGWQHSVLFPVSHHLFRACSRDAHCVKAAARRPKCCKCGSPSMGEECDTDSMGPRSAEPPAVDHFLAEDCPRCSVRQLYCSAACRSAGWPGHERICAASARTRVVLDEICDELAESSRPSFTFDLLDCINLTTPDALRAVQQNRDFFVGYGEENDSLPGGKTAPPGPVGATPFVNVHGSSEFVLKIRLQIKVRGSSSRADTLDGTNLRGNAAAQSLAWRAFDEGRSFGLADAWIPVDTPGLVDLCEPTLRRGEWLPILFFAVRPGEDGEGGGSRAAVEEGDSNVYYWDACFRARCEGRRVRVFASEILPHDSI